MSLFRRILLIGVAVLMLEAVAAPFAEWFEIHTSFGTTVRVWGEGDEYSAVFESEAGYTILYDSSRKAYFYAVQEADSSLALSDLELGAPGAADAIATRAQPHLRDRSEKAREARADRIRRDETLADRAERWAALKKKTRAVREAKEKGLLMAPPTRPTIGTVKGLTVLIDFPIADSSATTWSSVHPKVTVAELDALLNGDDCTLYGNASSVHSYFKDASNGRLDYSMAVIGPIMAPRPRSYYDDSSRDNGECARELIADVFSNIWNDVEFSTKYLPILQSLSTQNSTVRSLNFWFAGESASTWSQGLWAHQWTVGSTIASNYKFAGADGTTVKFGTYQITPILSSPGIYTFCHENGHMLCDFPDLYCYDGTGNKGVGYFSLMYGSANKANPPYFDPYLRTAAGWVEPQLLPSTGGVVTVRANHTDIWKYANPSNPEEYYLVENRQQTGRDASIRASGILIWRCNESGSNMYPTTLSGFASGINRLSNELSVEQADGDYEIEQNSNYGDKWDAWYSGNSYSKGVFNDSSVPTAQWSDASDSGLSLSNFSSNGEMMTFTVGAYVPAAEIPLATAVDNETLKFATAGDARWTGQTTKSTYGGSAAKSGTIGNSQYSWFNTAVEGPGEISFAWAVSSEANYDFLEFSIDGVRQDRISGTTGTWSTKTYEVDAGEHVFVWSYVKDSSTAKGDDAGYVDKIVWTPTKAKEKVAPGVWTNDVELVRSSAALDGKLICVARLKSSLSYWNTIGPLLTGERFLDWAASNGVYLVFWDGDADTSGTSDAAQWFKTLNAQRGKTSSYNWEMCFALPSAPETLAGYGRAFASGSTHYYVGSVRYEETAASVIAGFASVLQANGLTPTPILAESDIASFLQTSDLTWGNRSALSWRDEAVDETHALRAGGFTNMSYVSTLSATANGPGRLTFTYRAVSGSPSNAFRFNVNGVERLVRSDGTFAATETVTVTTSGDATFDWIWSVGSATDEKYSNGVWISDVSWTPLSPRVAVGGTTYETLAAAIAHANSRTPLVFESTPTIDAAARTVTSAVGETVTVADIYDLRLDDNTVTLMLVESIRKPSEQPFTRVTWRAGQKTAVQVPAFTEDADGAGRPALSVLTKPNFYYALGSVADNGDVTEISDWVAGDGTPQQLKACEPSGSSLGRDHYTVLVSEVTPLALLADGSALDAGGGGNETPKEFTFDGTKYDLKDKSQTVTLNTMTILTGAATHSLSIKKATSATASSADKTVAIVELKNVKSITSGKDTAQSADVVITPVGAGTTTITLSGTNSKGTSKYPLFLSVTVLDDTESTVELVKISAPTAETGLVYTGAEQTGVVEADGFTLTGNVATDAGEYVAVATLVDGYCWDDGSEDSVEIAWSIARKAATVSVAAGQGKDVGSEEPVLEVTAEGLVASDPATYVWKAWRDPGEEIGTYAVHLAAEDVPSNGNYDFTFVGGTFEIVEPSPAAVVIEALTKDESYEAAVAKVEAIVGDEEAPIAPQELADWITGNTISSAALAQSDYIVASANLDASAPITTETEVELVEVAADQEEGFTFKIELTFEGAATPEVVKAAQEKVAGYIQVVDDLGDGFSETIDPERVSVDLQSGRVTITPDPAKASEFFRIFLSPDPTH